MKLYNPVLRNEHKRTERSIKFAVMLSIYVLIVVAIALIVYRSQISGAYYSGISLTQGYIVYTWLAIMQAIMLMFIVPSMTATVITSEREKQTLDVLLSTKMSPLAIILGKLFSSVSKIIILIICTLPIYTLCSFIGGMEVGNILGLGLFFIITTIFAASIGTLISTLVKTSKVATVLTYASVLFIYGGIFIISIIYQTLSNLMNYSGSITTPFIANFSPAYGLMSLLMKQTGFNNMYYLISTGSENIYIYSMIIQVILSVVFIALATYKLNPIKYRGKKG